MEASSTRRKGRGAVSSPRAFPGDSARRGVMRRKVCGGHGSEGTRIPSKAFVNGPLFCGRKRLPDKKLLASSYSLITHQTTPHLVGVDGKGGAGTGGGGAACWFLVSCQLD